MKSKDVLEFARQNEVKTVDLKFTDLMGTWQHFSVPISELDEMRFTDGFSFAGSSVNGSVNSQDMLFIPDPTTATIDPFMSGPVLSLICNIADPVTKESYSQDPRYIARKAENYLKTTGLGDAAYFGPEVEFTIFSEVKFGERNRCGYFFIDPDGNGDRDYYTKPSGKAGYFPVPPIDDRQSLNTEIRLEMEKAGIEVAGYHYEATTASRAEVVLKHSTMLNTADRLMWVKYIIRNVARRNGKTASLMPKPIFGDRGSGMNLHVSIWKKESPLFAGNKYGGLSEMALHFIGGILRHARAVTAFTNPTTNSYRRLVPGSGTPVHLAYSSRNRGAVIHTPVHSTSPVKRRLEVQFPDPSCNGYLAFAAILMAGIDGIQNRIEPGEPLDRDVPLLTLEDIPTTPTRLEEALNSLEEDNAFLLKGNVFTEDVIAKWIKHKTVNEVNAVWMRPAPYEFILYHDV